MSGETSVVRIQEADMDHAGSESEARGSCTNWTGRRKGPSFPGRVRVVHGTDKKAKARERPTDICTRKADILFEVETAAVV